MVTRPAAHLREQRVPEPLAADLTAIAITPEIEQAIADIPDNAQDQGPYTITALKRAAAAHELTMDLLVQTFKRGLSATWPDSGRPDYKTQLAYAVACLQCFGIAPMPGRGASFVQVNNQTVIRDERAVERVADIARRLIKVNK